MHFPCICTFFSLYVLLLLLLGTFLIIFLSLPLFLFTLVVFMAPKRKSTPTRNPLCSDASSSSDPSPSNLQFRDDDAFKAFLENFSRRDIHLEHQVVMTFVLHPLSHYNSITEPRARFLLSLFEHRTIDFPSHFILSIIDVHLDLASRDKLIFLSAITRILHHFSVPFPSSDQFIVMCAIDYATVKRSEAQFWSRQSDSAAPSSRFAPSTFVPSSLGDVSLGDVMAQLQRMDARLDTLSTELYHVNVRVGRIARRQASMGGFSPEATPSPPFPIASESEDNDDDDGDDDDAFDDANGDANSTDEMST